MIERAAITEVDDVKPRSEPLVEQTSFTCAGGCQNHQTLIAVFYTPIVLIFGGLVALATFPEIAEYAAPWIADPVSQHVCPSVGSTSSRLTGNGLTNGCPNAGCSSVAGLQAESCEHREFANDSDTTLTLDESILTEELEKSFNVRTGETSADALTIENTNPTTAGSY